MKKLFYLSTILLIFFEIANVYFIMPMPGSQEMNSIDLAYFLYSNRWIFRIALGLLIVVGFLRSWSSTRKIVRILLLIPLVVVVYLFNFLMVADKMFLQPGELIMMSQFENRVPLDRIIIGIADDKEAKAYPVEYLAYHHQVRDKIDNRDVIITYCSVCRTGRVFETTVQGKQEKFRLVGMDHFNAMFEDESTGSWWRQVNGEAIAGDLKGSKLTEVICYQMSLQQWLSLYPNSLIMQADPASVDEYDPDAKFEKGESKNALTGTNPNSWSTKSWVVGIQIDNAAKAYDWNDLCKAAIINDAVNQTNLVLVLDAHKKSFVAFERPTVENFTVNGDTLFHCNKKYNFLGVNYQDKSDFLKRIPAYQEFWHSWQTFHPGTEKYVAP